MEILGIRFCAVSEEGERLAEYLHQGMGLPLMEVEGLPPPGEEGFGGAVFPASDGSWIEVWPEGPGMPPGIMLQIVVDDADDWAAQARANGLEPQGPMDAHGERIYYFKAPADLPVTIQSKIS